MVSQSKFETKKLAAKLVQKILKTYSKRGRKAAVIALRGGLGAGKTTFVQGFMKPLGVKHLITSPTFVIYRKYHLNEKRKAKSEKFLNVYHFDLYRIHKPKEILNMGFKKIIGDPRNIVLIEWPEKVRKLLPRNTIWINFKQGKKVSQRLIRFQRKNDI